MAQYKYVSDQADAVTYTSESTAAGKERLTAWLKGKTFDKGGDVVVCGSPQASMTFKLPLTAVEDDNNWKDGVFGLPANVLEMTAEAEDASKCFAAVRKAARSIGPALFSDLVYRQEGGKGEFITVQVDENDSSKWQKVG